MSNTDTQQEPSRFELFSKKARADIDAYQKELLGDGTFSYVQQVLDLQRLGNHLNQRLLTYMFGEVLGAHLAEKFGRECQFNLLVFFSRLSSEYRFFILYELKNNKILFSYS